MIKFFRNIRNNLLNEGKITSYLKYALGEIILVVIGILIALQINNWNQAQNDRKLTEVFISNFIREINSDIITLDERIRANETRIKNIDSIMQALANKDTMSEKELISFYNQNESLAYDSYFIPEKTTFRQLESTNNNNVIPNKDLRDFLYQYYVLNERNEKNGEISTQLYQHNFLTKDIMKNVLSGDILKLTIGSTFNRPQLDLEALRQNSDYIFALGSKKAVMQGQNYQYQNIKENAEQLLKHLKSKK